MKTEVSGALTGKYLNSGSSLVRPKATGEGCACFTAEMHNQLQLQFIGVFWAMGSFLR
jgi:glutamate dehydrogenase/leucine dehydrogenase